MSRARIKRVLKAMEDAELSQLLISDPMSIYYLTGYYNEPGERFFALYLNESKNFTIFLNDLFPDFDFENIHQVRLNDTSDISAVLAKTLNAEQKLGVDKNLPARFLLPMLENHLVSGFINGSSLVDDVRAIKAFDEQEKMRVVSAINDRAMVAFKQLIVPGVTEKMVANQILSIYLELGADDISFTPIVAFGKNAADPHHFPDDTVLKAGDCVLFDVGCKKDMYCSDMTRTFFYQYVSDAHRTVYETVRAANQAAIEQIKPGVALNHLDQTAREVIGQAGFGSYFTHRLGHFIGLDVHEYGDVSSSNTKLIQSGMIFSIEPGIYLPDDVGVRIEDLLLVTDEGAINLNSGYPKTLEIIE
ncbi:MULTISPECIES: Xaa-Pro peptidase family protein [unclassified Enterococcus]|uniref:M24 family metallopeptidase n=1 Tax=unclassified Enterococcus TaxID=2608891 RepID=UPI001554C2A8|nr:MULTISPECIES: Xaa-Pro peptidase family protein [unclassified Enterococcus]MBS7577510.1 aminopeptidase P family protein [Enterococcus sp. MMGLQ5-2]MBS7584991.1 aminopeptidase P family protein [Enterococcus sp. MMGLQ5-1]NPD12846.1 aminopeptidase P family protein [Enterococcus sp. MMGLQ5-1]NPD37343.1 aminopeptidase P family protein [Enterococcus sp. MMGLQ5-2]